MKLYLREILVRKNTRTIENNKVYVITALPMGNWGTTFRIKEQGHDPISTDPNKKGAEIEEEFLFPPQDTVA